jgi:HTH-type transcriptional regulator/antitoxin HigA
MSKLKLTQAWVSRVTSESDEFVASGHGKSPMPTQEELSRILKRASGTVALREMVRRKWFAPSEGDRTAALGTYLFGGVRNRPAFAQAALFRRQARQRDLVEEITTLAWLCRVRDEADSIDAPSFDPARLTSKSVSHLVHLSKDAGGPKEAVHFLRTLGIRVIIESSLPGMRTDGASFVLKDRGPVVGLTLRYDRLDSFWFTLLHEVAHIFLHLRGNSEAVFIDTIEDEDIELGESEVEAEADAFAKDSFVPRDAWLRSDAFRLGTEAAIFALAKKFEVHPAIVAGRLRFERRRYEAFTQLLGAGEVRGLLMAE